VHPEVVVAMFEVGVDLTAASTARLTREVAKPAQVVVTMGCREQCANVTGAERDDWPL
jgi:arsenate reductase